MKASYLIKLVEEFCKENNSDISQIYNTLSEEYQAEYGMNIVLEMQSVGECEMPRYLESRNIVERYISILNRFKKGLCLNY